MTRSKKKNLDEISELKREIKERDAIIKSLQRELKALNKELTPVKKAVALPAVESSSDKCSSCHKGKVVVVDLGPRTMSTCSACGFRVLKKRG